MARGHRRGATRPGKKSNDDGRGPAAATPKEKAIESEGTIVEPMPNAMFRVEPPNSHRILLELSPYDLAHGRITYRYK